MCEEDVLVQGNKQDAHKVVNNYLNTWFVTFPKV